MLTSLRASLSSHYARLCGRCVSSSGGRVAGLWSQTARFFGNGLRRTGGRGGRCRRRCFLFCIGNSRRRCGGTFFVRWTGCSGYGIGTMWRRCRRHGFFSTTCLTTRRTFSRFSRSFGFGITFFITRCCRRIGRAPTLNCCRRRFCSGSFRISSGSRCLGCGCRSFRSSYTCCVRWTFGFRRRRCCSRVGCSFRKPAGRCTFWCG